jgi:hypothetical protein
MFKKASLIGIVVLAVIALAYTADSRSIRILGKPAPSASSAATGEATVAPKEAMGQLAKIHFKETKAIVQIIDDESGELIGCELSYSKAKDRIALQHLAGNVGTLHLQSAVKVGTFPPCGAVAITYPMSR